MNDPLDKRALEAAGGWRIAAGFGFLVLVFVAAIVVMAITLGGR